MTALIDVDQLRTFIAIVETGSFTKAAEVVNKTQSAVSMQMKRLEERIERPIFARDGRASKLTEDGQRLLDYARRIVKLNVETLAAFSDAELSGCAWACPTIMPTAICPRSWRASRASIPASNSP
jgi:DNA-binding transcriptional LysR family regulator